MWVERDRVGALQTVQPGAPSFGECSEAAVRRVGMEPHAQVAADLGELCERVDRARVGRARARGDEQRRAPCVNVRLDRGAQHLGSEPEGAVARQHANLLWAEAEHARGTGE